MLNMVDGVLLIVDAADGPKPQTRFVLKKAIAMGQKILVVLNKIDKPTAQPGIVTDKTFDLFCELGASDEQTDFEIVYTSAINRQSGREPEVADGMDALLDAILDLPKPVASVDDPLQLQISNLGSDPYIGRAGSGADTIRHPPPTAADWPLRRAGRARQARQDCRGLHVRRDGAGACGGGVGGRHCRGGGRVRVQHRRHPGRPSRPTPAAAHRH